MITKGIAAACVYQKLTAKAAETIKSSPEILGAQPGLVSVLQEDSLVFFILEHQCHHAWLSKGIDGFGGSNPQQAAALDGGGAQLVPCLWHEEHVWEEEGLWLFRPHFSTQLPSRVPSGPVWGTAKWG